MKNKGFTLAEMVAVIAILMVLALLSAPFVKGYIDDAYNGKAQIFLRQLNEARLNFEKDYPGTTVSGEFNYTATSGGCNLDGIYGKDGEVPPDVLVNCNYLKVPTELRGRYLFGVRASCICKNNLVVMRGDTEAGAYEGKCACFDDLGQLYKEEIK